MTWPPPVPTDFPDGQAGCCCDLPHTCLQHVNFQLMKMLMDEKKGQSDNVVNPLLQGGSLGLQYIVNQFAKKSCRGSTMLNVTRRSYAQNSTLEKKMQWSQTGLVLKELGTSEEKISPLVGVSPSQKQFPLLRCKSCANLHLQFITFVLNPTYSRNILHLGDSLAPDPSPPLKREPRG